jgi:hypothetical protein
MSWLPRHCQTPSFLAVPASFIRTGAGSKIHLTPTVLSSAIRTLPYLLSRCHRFVPVIRSVLLCRFRSVMRGVVQVPLSGMRMMRRRFVVAGFVMRGRLAMVSGRMVVMFGCSMMMFCRLLGHESSS